MDVVTLIVQGLGTLAWPAVVAFVLWTFRASLGTLLSSGTVSVKAGGVEISTTARAEATTALQDAAAAKSTPMDATTARSRVDASAAVLSGRTAPPRVLWVDDRPSGNRLERETLLRLGMVVEEATSTTEALAVVMRSAPFDVVVSDMTRDEGAGPSPLAGIALLQALRTAGVQTPFVVYSGSAGYDQAIAAGALGCTDRPAELLTLIIQALRR